MASVKMTLSVIIQCACKAIEKGLKRSLANIDFRSLVPHKKIIKHTAGTLVMTVTIIGMALPNTISADANNIQSAEVQPNVAMAEKTLEETLEDFTVYGMYLNTNESTDSSVAIEAPATSVTSFIGNNGYPFAKKAEEGVTLAIEVTDAGTEVSYQWQYSDDKTQWSNIKDATASIFENNSPKDGRWYRCVVNDTASNAVQIIGKFKCDSASEKDSSGRIWTKSLMPWYISNGYVAYGISQKGTTFDVVGLYEKGGKAYMIQTAYSDGWKMVTSASDAPALEHTAAQLDDLKISFVDGDNYNLYIEADLAAGQTAFAFGCDTMLGNADTSNAHSDSAALEVNKNADNTLANIAMVGAISSGQSSSINPGFVITPVTGGEIEFWLGHYNERKYFDFNTGTGNITVEGDYIDNICTEALGIDAGMTMSWFNVPDGESVSFMFAVGNASSIGVNTNSANINYTAELIEGLGQNTNYVVKVEGVEGTYSVRSNALGHISFTGVDTNGTYFDFTGKNLNITKNDGESQGINISITSRPVNIQDLPDSDEVISIGDTSVDVTIPLGSLQLFAQEYRICDESGRTIEGFGWTRPTGDGQFSFEGLQSNTTYTIRARIIATDSTPASQSRQVYKLITN